MRFIFDTLQTLAPNFYGLFPNYRKMNPSNENLLRKFQTVERRLLGTGFFLKAFRDNLWESPYTAIFKIFVNCLLDYL